MTTIRTLTDLEGQPHANIFPKAEPKTTDPDGPDAVP